MSKELEANTTLSHYRIIRKLSAGGMGEVFLAEDSRLRRKVALKVLPENIAQEKERLLRFEREAFAASALNHPNILTIFEFGVEGPTHFLASEFVTGETLRDRLSKGILTVSETLEIALQIASALQAAHSAGIVHRDIKPENVMIRDDGYVKVLDFGLAKLLEQTPVEEEAGAKIQLQTQAGMIMGTVAYMSPEQARGRETDARTDIFSLGAVLYEMLARRQPFTGETINHTIVAILEKEPPPLTLFGPGFPAEIRRIVDRCLAKDPRRRYQTAKDLLDDLKELKEELSFRAKLERTSAPDDVEPQTQMLPVRTTAEKSRTSDTGSEEGFWVAVLPFKYRGTNPDLEALAEGLSEEIVTGLSRFSYLRVIARGSTLRFTEEAVDVRAAGEDLGARYLLEGNLRQAGNKLRLAVRLVDAATGGNLWAENYERDFGPEIVFEVQDDLVPRIVSTCADHFGVLVRSISSAVRGKDARHLTPYEALMRGFGYHYLLSPRDHAEAREVLEKAVEESPNNADCWAMLSWIYSHEYGHGFNPRPGSLERALAAARRAVELAPSNHLAYQTLAVAHFFRKEKAPCLSAAERAISLNPLDASNEAIFLITFTGDWERGCALIRRALDLNPHCPGWYRLILALDEYRKTNYRGAAAEAVKANITGLWADITFAVVYGQLGEEAAARESVRNLSAYKIDSLESAREPLAKWFETELVEHLLDGLRKAGLEITSAPNQEGQTTQIRTANPTAEELSPSIAILPFTNMSADEENEYFCDGLAEELLNALAKIDELKVAARTSAFSFKNKNAEAREIGKTLNVNTVLEGSVRKAGNRIRISVQLVNAEDGYHLWSERYDREMSDVFDVQDEITVSVVEALKVKLLGEERAAVLKRHTRSPEAHESYLRGLFYFNRWTPDDFQKAGECFSRAIAIDPRYASAYAGLADAYTEMAFFSFAGEWMPKAREAAGKALELDDTLAEAHTSLAIIKMYFDWDYAGAEAEFKRAIALNPGGALIRMWYGWYLGLMGRFDESFKELRRAQELDPLSDTINSGVGIILYWSGQTERAIEQFRKVLGLNPNYSLASNFLAEAYERKGDFVSAIATVEKARQAASGPLTLSTAGYVYARSGNHQKALEILNEFEKRSNREYVPALNFAQIYAGLGDHEQALAWLEKACDERAVWMPFLKADLKFDALRSDPRFAEILQRVGFPAGGTGRTSEPPEARTAMPKSEPPAAAGGLSQTSQDAFISSTAPITDLRPSAGAEAADPNPKPKWLLPGLLGLIVLVGGFFAYRYFTPANKQIESIAVMPFQNDSGNADVEYLSDGMAETLIKSLSNLPNLNVKPRSSVFRYKGKDTDLQTIARELNVQAILSGRVVQRGEQLTLSLELVDVRQDKVIWTESYNRKQSDLVTLQSEIARDVSINLKSKLSGAEETKVAKAGTADAEAYQAYLKGRYYWNRRTTENLKKAIEQFKIATDRDPNYALAFAGLADCYAVLYEYAGTPTSDTIPQAKAYAERALMLDSQLAEPYATFGSINVQSWQWAEAEKEYKRAIEINPNYATAYHWYSIFLKDTGRNDEAAAMIKRAGELDPLSSVISVNITRMYQLQNNHEASIENSLKTIELDPNFGAAYEYLGLSYLKQGRQREAVAALEKAAELTNRSSITLGHLGYVYAATGKRAEAIAVIKEVEDKYARKEANGQYIAFVYAGLGEKDKAFEWLEKDFKARNGKLAEIRWQIPYESLSDDPRFKDLLRRMNLPE